MLSKTRLEDGGGEDEGAIEVIVVAMVAIVVVGVEKDLDRVLDDVVVVTEVVVIVVELLFTIFIEDPLLEDVEEDFDFRGEF